MSDLKLVGITIGTHDGWDQSGDTSFTFYNFKSSIVNLEDADYLDFNWETGVLKSYDDNGNIIWSCNLLEVLTSEL